MQPDWYTLHLDIWKLILKQFELQDIYKYLPMISKFFNCLVKSMEQNEYDIHLLNFHLSQNQSYWCKSLDLFKKSYHLKLSHSIDINNYSFETNFNSPYQNITQNMDNRDSYFCSTRNDIIIIFHYIYDYICINQIDTNSNKIINLGIINFRQLGYYCFKHSGFWIKEGESFACLLFEENTSSISKPFSLIYCIVEICFRDRKLDFDFKIIKTDHVIENCTTYDCITKNNSIVIKTSNSLDSKKITLIYCSNFGLDSKKIKILDQKVEIDSTYLPIHNNGFCYKNNYVAVMGFIQSILTISIFHWNRTLKHIKDIKAESFIHLLDLKTDEILLYDIIAINDKDDQNITFIVLIEVYNSIFYNNTIKKCALMLHQSKNFEFDEFDFYDKEYAKGYFNNIHKTLSTISQIEKNKIKVLSLI